MPNSLTFNGHDLSDYGLTVLSRETPISLSADSVQLQRTSFAGDSKVPPKQISLSVAVTAESVATLKSNLDIIQKYLNETTDKNLILDSLSDRYWLARFRSLTGTFKGSLFRGSLDFVCHDPLAYSNTETSTDLTIDADPKTVSVTPGGSALIEPVFTLTADGNLVAVTIKVENHTLEQEIEWTGTVLDTQELAIDSANWIVYLQSVVSMATASGPFPLLTPGTNSIIVTGFNGNLNVKYRNRYV